MDNLFIYSSQADIPFRSQWLVFSTGCVHVHLAVGLTFLNRATKTKLITFTSALALTWLFVSSS